MAQLLVINPNTSGEVSSVIEALARDEAGAEHEVRVVTARFGFPYIASRAAFAIAGHAVLDAAAEALDAGARPDAIVLGCFGDPGLDALEELAGLPVAGFAEAGLWEAAAEPGAFVVATRGAIWRDMLHEIVGRLGLADRVAAIACLDEDEPAAIARALSSLAAATGASRVVLGGAGLIPIMDEVTRHAEIPILDPHRAAIRKALRLAARKQRPALAEPHRGATEGLSPALRRVLSGAFGGQR
ncbi:aspartate/glutamate racemase family protein [Alsobacter sp. SYSU M60028]|uniref:Aspartate/glutamate racemase family protein n=1 Tax=Alsobacter ponti TaxID=2962936 RepID=A0ABT1LC63_9HYPH|nr:aspartate/glutamate racemase family protein [Alsobacter ponti]MCP8939092.1 aspartate/glutamate racemase family protein [Alsobacter ponti]